MLEGPRRRGDRRHKGQAPRRAHPHQERERRQARRTGDTVLIDQKDCMYTPRVVGIVAGQKLQVRNSDNTFHNVWGQVQAKDVFNKPQAPKADDLSLDPSTAKAGDIVDLKCGAHGWMKGYVAVQDHPFFAVTASDGSFTIKDLPQGTYTLEAWHPELGTKTMKVVIGKGKRADVSARFSYKQSER
jgi:plastocyanin